MKTLDQFTITQAVLDSMAGCTDERLRTVMGRACAGHARFARLPSLASRIRDPGTSPG